MGEDFCFQKWASCCDDPSKLDQLSIRQIVLIAFALASMVSEDELNLVRKQMCTVRAPAHYDRVFKDECQFSFDTALSPDGLYVNVNSWQAFGGDYVDIDSKKSGQQLYLHELWHKVFCLFWGERREAGVQQALPLVYTQWDFCRCHCQLRRKSSRNRHQKS